VGESNLRWVDVWIATHGYDEEECEKLRRAIKIPAG
jgi:hypothetical protein